MIQELFQKLLHAQVGVSYSDNMIWHFHSDENVQI